MSALVSCRKASRLASTAIDRPLPLLKRIELRLHLAMCSACRAYRRQITLIDRLVRSKRDHDDGDMAFHLDPEARKRISEALRRR